MSEVTRGHIAIAGQGDIGAVGLLLLRLLGARHCADDIRVSGVRDAQGADPEVLPAGGAQLVVVAGVVVDASLGQHSVVLDLRLAQGGRVVGDDHQLRLAVPARLQVKTNKKQLPPLIRTLQ